MLEQSNAVQKSINRKHQHKQVIEPNLKRIRFVRKLLNKIVSTVSIDLTVYQLRVLFNKNIKRMKEKMQSFVNATPTPGKRKRKHQLFEEENNTFIEELNNTLVINRIKHDLDDTSELLETNPKYIRVKQSLRKIAKIRSLPDYKRIEKILNMTDAIVRRRKRSLNSIVIAKNPTPFWTTYSYLLKEIENCVANKYWDKLTPLLIYLSSAVKKCEPHLLKGTIINFISNPTSQMHDLLEDFLKECYSCRTDQDINNLLTQLFHIKPKLNT